ncbi:hypothetical protein HOD29_06280 [archaeon]|jgi:hypothetical protein|nr:hypothetical protein [archaeon]
MAEIAKGYDLLAIDLSNYIARYVPGVWCVDIQNVHAVPHLLTKEVRELFGFHKEGDLVEKLKEKEGIYKPWFIQEAVNSFFDNQKYSSYEAELD